MSQEDRGGKDGLEAEFAFRTGRNDDEVEVSTSRRRDFIAGTIFTSFLGWAVFGESASANTPEAATYVRDSYVGPASAMDGLGSKGWLYFATDDSVFYNDGTEWIDLNLGDSRWSDADDDGLYEQDADGIDVPTVRQEQTQYRPAAITGDYATDGESLIFANSSAGAITITLSAEDAADGNVVTVVDTGGAASEHPITIETDGAQSIEPGGRSSISLAADGETVTLRNHDGDWYPDGQGTSEHVGTEEASIDEASIGQASIEEETVGQASIDEADVGTARIDEATVGRLQVTAETAVEAGPGSPVAVPEDAWTRIPLDRIERDTLGEVDDAAGVWSPRRSQDYRVTVAASTAGGSGNPGDTLQLVFRATNGERMLLAEGQRAGTAPHSLVATKTQLLYESEDYELVFRNCDSPDEIQADRVKTYLEVRREPVGI